MDPYRTEVPVTPVATKSPKWYALTPRNQQAAPCGPLQFRATEVPKLTPGHSLFLIIEERPNVIT